MHDLAVCAGHACPPLSHGSLGRWLRNLRCGVRGYKSYATVAASKVAALKAVGVEFDSGKARNIREQHEAQSKGKEAPEHSGLQEKGGEIGQANGAAGDKSRHAIAVGSQVCMLFDDGVWYPGHVTKFDSCNRKRPYTIKFEDGDIQKTQIPHPDVRLREADDGVRAAIAAAEEDGSAQGRQSGRDSMAAREGRANKGSSEGGVAEMELRESFDEKLEELKEYKRRHGAILRRVLAATPVAVVWPYGALCVTLCCACQSACNASFC